MFFVHSKNIYFQFFSIHIGQKKYFSINKKGIFSLS